MKLTHDATMHEVHGMAQKITEHFPEYSSEIQHELSPLDSTTIITLKFTTPGPFCVQRLYYRTSYSDISNSFSGDNWQNDNNEFIDFLNYLHNVCWPKQVDEWDARMLRLAAGELNTWSKDPSTKVSAVVFRGKSPIAMSYNGLPPGIADTEERLNNRELKLKLVQHAEANAISTCAKLGISTEGTTMAVTLFPCSSCAGMMISAGIKKVIVQEPTPELIERWGESFKLSKDMFDEAGIEVVTVDLKKE